LTVPPLHSEIVLYVAIDILCVSEDGMGVKAGRTASGRKLSP